MSFLNSSQVKIPLSDPYLKYGKTFRVSNIYLTSSSLPQTVNDLNDSSTSTSHYNQSFQTSYLDIAWDVIDPRNDYIYEDSESIENNIYISGFNLNIYENYGDLTGQNAIDNGVKVFSKSGIKSNSISYRITGENANRNYSVELTLIDFTGNSSKAILTTKNPEPMFSVLGTGFDKGVFYCNYDLLTGEYGQDLSNDFQKINLYAFTGLKDGHFPPHHESLKTGIGQNGLASVELTPESENYVMIIPFDLYSSGSINGAFEPQEYFTGIGFSGYVGSTSRPLMIEYHPQIIDLEGGRISGGDAFCIDFDVNYNTGSKMMNSCYGVTGTGQTSGSVSGYDQPIFFDSGELFNTDYGEYNIGNKYIYDNSESIQSGFNTGEMVESVFFEGVDFTGSGTFGSGAGRYWAESFPKYTGYIATGADGAFYSGGIYNYGYYDSSIDGFKCASYLDIKSGLDFSVNGMYSMPRDNPNSYDIKFHSGSNFQKTYEQSASYLNSMGRMPAVVVNKSQLNKIRKINEVGWVGLRRNKILLITELFSDYFVNQSLFDGLDVENETEREIEFINISGDLEKSNLSINDVGENWSWVNSSGSHIYKYAGSGYEKTREINVSLGIKNDKDESIYSTGLNLIAPLMKIDSITGESEGSIINFNYSFEDDFFNIEATGVEYNNYNVVKMNLYTGIGDSFEVSEDNLYEEFTLENYSTSMQSSISYIDSLSGDAPDSFKLLPFDTIGSGELKNATDFISSTNFTSSSQNFQYNLDEMKDNGDNFIQIPFPRNHDKDPMVNFGLQYTGDSQSAEYLGAMIVGRPTKSSVSFVLTNPPRKYGYCLNISTNQAD